MSDPLLRHIRKVRAQRSKELTADVDKAMRESRERQFTWGHDVVDYSSGKCVVVFKALRPPKETPES
jgi:hypothetical protein